MLWKYLRLKRIKMWIRNQCKRVLIDAKAIFICRVVDKDNSRIINYTNRCQSYSHESETDFPLLGVYSTEEKAMKVLDEWQCRIARSESGVFQMPEDEK